MSRVSRFRTTELGKEARCAKCGEWWPADKEFFYMVGNKPHSYCKACYIAWRVEHGGKPGYGKRPAYSDHVKIP